MAAITFPPDPGLPRLETAWDSDAMRDVFQHSLRTRGAADFDILGCHLMRFRYRPSTRSVLQYELRVRDPASGAERKQWVTGTVYADDRARRLYDKFRTRGCPGEEDGSAGAFEPVSLVPEMHMLIQVFPFDRRLPSLSRLVAGPTPGLEAALLDALGPGDWRLEQCQVAPVRHRASLGTTLRYTVVARDRSTRRRTIKRFYVKIYPDERGRRTYDLLRTLQHGARRGRSPFFTPPPVAYFDDLRALVLEAAPGKSLEQALLDGDDVSDAISAAARAVAGVHRSKATNIEHLGPDDCITRTRRTASYIKWACPALGAEIDEIVATVTERLRTTIDRPTHLDLKPDHVFLDGDRVIFIDLDSFALADPVRDPATLLARLEALPRFSSLPAARAEAARRTFAEEYFANVPMAWRKRLPAHYACAALDIALYALHHQVPAWQSVTALFVAKAASVMSNGPEFPPARPASRKKPTSLTLDKEGRQ